MVLLINNKVDIFNTFVICCFWTLCKLLASTCCLLHRSSNQICGMRLRKQTKLGELLFPLHLGPVATSRLPSPIYLNLREITTSTVFSKHQTKYFKILHEFPIIGDRIYLITLAFISAKQARQIT